MFSNSGPQPFSPNAPQPVKPYPTNTAQPYPPLLHSENTNNGGLPYPRVDEMPKSMPQSSAPYTAAINPPLYSDIMRPDQNRPEHDVFLPKS